MKHALREKQRIETLLSKYANHNPAPAIHSARDVTAYNVEMRGSGEKTVYDVIHTTTKKVWDSFQSEAEAESVATSLNSTVESLSYSGVPPKKSPESDRGNSMDDTDTNEGAA